MVGGGNFFRGAELQQAGIDRSRGDYMGMLGTVMNCLALQDFLEQEGQATRVQTAITMGQVAEPYIPLKAIRHLEKGRVVIFGAGAGMPYFSTDTVSIQRSLEIHCDEVLMGKNGVDGVYTADPRKDENAKRFETLSYNRALVDNLAVMDASALSMARDNKKRIRVFGLEEPGNVTRALVGDDLVGAASVEPDQDAAAFHQPRPEQRMGEIGPRRLEIGEPELPRHVAAAESAQLREDEPHPVAALVPLRQFAQHGIEHRGLGVDETLQRVHACRLRRNAGACRAAARAG